MNIPSGLEGVGANSFALGSADVANEFAPTSDTYHLLAVQVGHVPMPDATPDTSLPSDDRPRKTHRYPGATDELRRAVGANSFAPAPASAGDANVAAPTSDTYRGAVK
jgi:hypothetical protein